MGIIKKITTLKYFGLDLREKKIYIFLNPPGPQAPEKQPGSWS